MTDANDHDARLRIVETAYAVQEVRMKHTEDVLEAMTVTLNGVTDQLAALKETKDQTAGSFRIITIISAAGVAGVVSWIVGKLS